MWQTIYITEKQSRILTLHCLIVFCLYGACLKEWQFTLLKCLGLRGSAV